MQEQEIFFYLEQLSDNCYLPNKTPGAPKQESHAPSLVNNPMTLLDDILHDAGFSKNAIAEVKSGKLHYGGSLDAASDKELSVKLAFHVNAKLENAKGIFLDSPNCWIAG